ncbi:MAG: WG repeat-containing protein [Bacteroidetes bacterium]|nr:WG repeat-containing protein [Bacteroidota bacterium]
MDDLCYTSDFRYLLAKTGTKWGVVSDSLTSVIPPKYDTIYTHGSAIFCESVLKLDIYLNQKLLVSVDDFEQIEFEYADYGIYDISLPGQKERIIIHTLDQAIVTDNTFKLETAKKFDDAFLMEKLIYTRSGPRYGFISYTGKEIKPVYTSISEFNRDVLELTDEKNHRHYFLNDGRALPDTDSTLQFHDEFGVYKIYKNGKGYLYDENLNSVVTYSGEDIFCLNSLKWDYVNGKKSIPRFAFKKNEKIGVCNKDGGVLLPASYEYADHISDNRFIVMKDSLFGVVDNHGNWIVKPTYTFISNPYDSYIEVYNRNKKGLLDENGNIVVPIEFDELHCSARGVLTLTKGKFGFYNLAGRKILSNSWNLVFALDQNCYEFRNSDGFSCAVNANGLLTPLNCHNVYVGINTLKYYLDSTVVLADFENGIKSDSTVYEYDSRIVVNRDLPRSSVILNESPCSVFRDQLTGKTGSKNMEKTGFSIPPLYDNEFAETFTYVKVDSAAYFQIGPLALQTKEIIYPFFGNGCYGNDPVLVYLNEQSTGFSHSSIMDPVYTTGHKFEFASDNPYQPHEIVAAQARKNYTLVMLTKGELNFYDGQKFMDYRTYFDQLNSYHNLVIDDVETFSRLSDSPMIYASDAEWQVIRISEYGNCSPAGTFEYYQELKSGVAIYSKDSINYGIYFYGAENSSEDEFVQLIPVNDSYFQYFFVNKLITDADGISQSKWSVMHYTGMALPDHYDQVELIHSGYFIVTQNGKRWVTNESGQIIYEFQ